MNKNLTTRNSTAEFLIFITSNRQDSIEVKVATINECLSNIFKGGFSK